MTSPIGDVYVRPAAGYEEDVAGDRVTELSPPGSAAYVSHTLALSGSWPSFIGEKEVTRLENVDLSTGRGVFEAVRLTPSGAISHGVTWRPSALLPFTLPRSITPQQLSEAGVHLLRRRRRIDVGRKNEVKLTVKWHASK